MMNIKRVTRVLAAAFFGAALLTAACKESTGPSAVPGQLTVSVSTSGSGGAAFLITVTGSGISNPAAVNASHQFYSIISGSTLTAAVITQSAVSSGNLFRFSVPDVNQAASYNVSVVEVAGTDNELLSPSAFSVSAAN
jgi:hypothetical protein